MIGEMRDEQTWYYWVDLDRDWRAGRSNSRELALSEAKRFAVEGAPGTPPRAMRVICCRELDGRELSGAELIAEFAAGGEQTAGEPLTPADLKVF